MQDILKELWPGLVSIEQRYRFYRHAKVLETVSREQEKRLLDADCAEELRGTIKPDVVLHADRHLLRAILILDLNLEIAQAVWLALQTCLRAIPSGSLGWYVDQQGDMQLLDEQGWLYINEKS